MNKKPRVIMLGGGFAGLGAAHKLAEVEAEILLVDKHDYHTFQPMLYQVATDLVAAGEVGHPLRDIFHKQPNLRFHQAEVTSIDLAERQVYFREQAAVSYDYLVFAMGAKVNYFGVKGAEEFAFPMYTLPDAVSNNTSWRGGKRPIKIRRSSKMARWTSSLSTVDQPA